MNPALISAAGELRFLLEWGYPRRRSLGLVGDRHELDAAGREILGRGVLAPGLAAARRAKLQDESALTGQAVGLDGHNLFITLESALAGRTLVRCDDGVIRDIARAARNYRLSELTGRALELILKFLSQHEALRAEFFLDEPVSHSGELARLIREGLAKAGLAGAAEAVAVPERALIPFAGPVASSDGQLIDACSRPIDLAGLIIRDFHRGGIVELQG